MQYSSQLLSSGKNETKHSKFLSCENQDVFRKNHCAKKYEVDNT